MRKTYQDFKLLDNMTDYELSREIDNTKEEIALVMDAFKSYEEELELEAQLNGTPKCFIQYPKVEVLTKNLANLESYIRKAENLINEYEPYIYIKKINKKRVRVNRDAVEDVQSTDSITLSKGVKETVRKPFKKRKVKRVL